MTAPQEHIVWWTDPAYVKAKEDTFHCLDQYLPQPPKRILDIGCGYAHVSEHFQRKYGTELYLLDGDIRDNPATANRTSKYGPVQDFMFYSTVEDLRKSWDSRNLKYTFIDANNINIAPDVKFDLVYSWISCGFHYPISVYKKLIQQHTDANSTIIMDFRRKALKEQAKDFDIVHRLNGTDVQKKYRLHIKLKD